MIREVKGRNAVLALVGIVLAVVAVGVLVPTLLLSFSPISAQVIGSGSLETRLSRRPGPFAGPVDVADMVSDLTGLVRTRADAIKLAGESGFRCRATAESELWCGRDAARSVCRDIWTISFQMTPDDRVVHHAASAMAVCL